MKKRSTFQFSLLYKMVLFCWVMGFWSLSARAQTQYCTTNLYTNGCSGNDRVDLFTFNTINNPSSNCNPDGYSDYTSLSTTVNKGGTYQMTMRSNAASAQGFGVWIDYNSDKDFDDAGEMVYNSAATGTQVFSTSINIPASAVVGTTRLRVRSIRSAVPVSNGACTQFTYGETEDYSVVVSPLQQYCTTGLYSEYCLSATSLISNVTFAGINNSTSSCPASNRYSNFTNLSGAVQLGNTYSFSINTVAGGFGSMSLGIWIDFNRDFDFDDAGEFILGRNSANLHTGTITIPQNATAGPVRMRIRTSNSFSFVAGESCTSEYTGETEDYTLNIAGTPQYCTNSLYSGGCDYNRYITNFSLGTINNVTTSCTGQGYVNFTSQNTVLQQGQQYTMSMQASQANMGFGVWIDYNNDKSFNDQNEFIYASPTATTQVYTTTFTVPANAPLGTVRLRVRGNNFGLINAAQACTQFIWGETEDYSVTIAAPSSPVDVGVSTINNPITACGLSAQQTVGVTLQNFGTIPQSNFPVKYAVNGTVTANETFTGTLAPGATAVFNFTTPANLSAAATYNLKAWTELSSDLQRLNDTVKVSVTNSGSGITSFPYTEHFENFGVGNSQQNIPGTFKNGWAVDLNANAKWYVENSGVQNSLGTGPLNDHSGNGKYVFVKGSGASPAYQANLETPCITLTGQSAPTLEFWYHMYGANMGTLAVDVNDGGTWTLNVFSLTGQQQTSQTAPWAKATVALAAFQNKTIRLRFRVITGTNYLSDIALDDVRLYDAAAVINDVGASTITKPTATGCDKKATEEVCVMLTNYGNTKQENFYVGYRLDNQNVVVEPFADSLLPGQTKQYCFQAKANMLAPQTYKLRAFTMLTPDNDMANDTARTSITNIVSALNFTYTNATGSSFQFSPQGVSFGGTVKWYFGDGDSSSVTNATHIYSLPGAYTVTLKGTDFRGCSVTIQKIVSVLGSSTSNDIGAIVFSKPAPGNACGLTGNEELCVSLTNFGNVKQKNFSVSYKLNSQAIITEQFTDSLMPSQTKQFCFSAKANLSAAGTYSIKAYTSLTNDLNRNNDTARISVTNRIPNLTFSSTAISPTGFLFTPQNLSATAPVKWYFGDGDSAMTASPLHYYPAPGTYTVVLKGTDQQGCAATVQQTVTILSTGLKEVSERSFKLYPNPANTNFTLKFSDYKLAREVEIVSVLGQKVKVQQIAAGEEEVWLNVEQLPAGTYLVRITDAASTYVKPLIIQK